MPKMNSNFRNTELCTIGNTNHKNKKFPSLKCLIFYQVALSPGMGMKEHQTFLTVWERSSVLYTAETLSIFQTTNWAQRPGECLHDLKKLTMNECSREKSARSKTCVHHPSGSSILMVSKFAFNQVR